jgi:hypothetical protein
MLANKEMVYELYRLTGEDINLVEEVTSVATDQVG